MVKFAKWFVGIVFLCLLIGGVIICMQIHNKKSPESKVGDNMRETKRDPDARINARKLLIPADNPQQIQEQMDFARKLKERDEFLVELSNGCVYDLKDKETLIAMLRADEREQEIMALYALMRASQHKWLKDREVTDSIIRLYEQLLSHGPEQKRRLINAMIVQAFSLIMVSDDPRKKQILQDAKRSDSQMMEELGRSYEQRQKGREKRRRNQVHPD